MRRKSPTCSFGGLTGSTPVIEAAYVRLVTRMVQRPMLMLLLFITIIGITGWRFASHPTGFMPTDDQGFAMVITRLPDASSQPRVMAVSEKISAVLRETKGLKAWVTIGGFSILDFANVSNFITTFIVYDDWDKRGAALSQDVIIAKLRQELAAIEEAGVFVGGAAAHPGLGGVRRFPVDDRGPGQPGSGRTAEDRPGGDKHRQFPLSGLRYLATTFSARSPQLFPGH